ncbi:aromatic motif membrane protein [Mycoplasma sp. 1781]
MKKINKIILSTSFISVLPLSYGLVSCINNEPSTQLRNNIPKGFEYIPNIENPDEVRTNLLIKQLIDLRFKGDEVAKTNFLESQKDEKKLFDEAKKITKKFTDENNEENIKKLRDFYSKNWLFVIKNIKRFTWTFLDWWKFPDFGQVKHSDEFIASLKNHAEKFEPNDANFIDNNWDQLREGDESPESKDDIFYLKKNKFLLRILISKNKSDKSFLTFDRMIYFPKSISSKISIKLVSDAVHNAIIHHNKRGFDAFENVVVKNYNFPALGLLILKDI